ncbi:MAG: BNR-4 repeat-containing protein [Verrucomicrobia bacterium]|nr:BNR-4 repeat-containing protein [Verrucomicrobiota bacterium]
MKYFNIGKPLLLALTICATLSSFAAAPVRPPGPGASFNGLTQSVTVKKDQFQQPKMFSVAAWVRLNGHDEPQVFINRGERGHLFTLYLYEGRVRMLVEYAEGRYAYAFAPRPGLETWTHYLGTYDGETIQLYVNGELAGTAKAKGAIPTRNDPLIIGARAPTENVLIGRMEDVRIYSAALSADDARQLFTGGNPFSNSLVLRLTGQELEKQIVESEFLGGETMQAVARGTLPTTDGFRGIWYANQRSSDEYVYKYSGGLGTYPQQHHPIAIHVPEVQKTFFTYGGTRKDRNRLLHMVSVYDHQTGKVARPRILLDKQTTDAHDNPTISIDGEGYIWIFSNAHGTGRPAYIHRSDKPYSIDSFHLKLTTNFSYSQPWHLKEHGFVFLHTRYASGRMLHVWRSEDGDKWNEPTGLASIAQGHYQISWPYRSRLGTAFNYHPKGKGLNHRTNLYYTQSEDGGKTWTTVDGQPLKDLPLTEVNNPALIAEYESKDLVIYMKDLTYTEEGHPVILYMTTGGWQSGPENDPRIFTTARWTGKKWDIHEVTRGDNNYDFASLYIEADGLWRLIGSTEPGPQRYNTGGEIAMWTSRDQGRSWSLLHKLTQDSEYNHTYPRRPLNAHPGFYAFWADGHGREQSSSRFYFATREGSVFRLPETITGDAQWIEPERIR